MDEAPRLSLGTMAKVIVMVWALFPPQAPQFPSREF